MTQPYMCPNPACTTKDAPIRTSGSTYKCFSCSMVSKGPAPDRDYVSRTEHDAAKWERMHTERPSRRVSAYSDDEWDPAEETR